jgi:ubiquinone/menaquinone biosynthesis C-methylase UbiE
MRLGLEIQPGEKILEVGSGNLPYYRLYANRVGEHGLFVAIDLDPKIQKRARKILYFFNQPIEASPISHAAADVHQLPFTDNFFNAFVARNLLYTPEYYKEAYRILKPGGRLLSTFSVSFHKISADASYCEKLGFANIQIRNHFSPPHGFKTYYIEAYKPHQAMSRNT